jgi:hypothetical protein
MSKDIAWPCVAAANLSANGAALMGDVIRLFRSTAFDPEAVQILGEAYDSAIRSISATEVQILGEAYGSAVAVGLLEKAEDLVAQQIISLARQGERNVERLRNAALRRLRSELVKVEANLHRDFLRKLLGSRHAITMRVEVCAQTISESRNLIERVDKQLQQQWL